MLIFYLDKRKNNITYLSRQSHWRLYSLFFNNLKPLACNQPGVCKMSWVKPSMGGKSPQFIYLCSDVFKVTFLYFQNTILFD